MHIRSHSLPEQNDSRLIFSGEETDDEESPDAKTQETSDVKKHVEEKVIEKNVIDNQTSEIVKDVLSPKPSTISSSPSAKKSKTKKAKTKKKKKKKKKKRIVVQHRKKSSLPLFGKDTTKAMLNMQICSAKKTKLSELHYDTKRRTKVKKLKNFAGVAFLFLHFYKNTFYYIFIFS